MARNKKTSQAGNENVDVDTIVERVKAICEISIGESEITIPEDVKSPEKDLFEVLNKLQKIDNSTSIDIVIDNMKDYYKAVSDNEGLVDLYCQRDDEKKPTTINSAVKLMLGRKKQTELKEIDTGYLDKVYKRLKSELSIKIPDDDINSTVSNYLDIIKVSDDLGFRNIIVHVAVQLRKFFAFCSESVKKATNQMKIFEKNLLQEKYPLLEANGNSVFQNSGTIRRYYWREYKLPGDTSPFSMSFFIEQKAAQPDTYEYKVAFEIKTDGKNKKDEDAYNSSIPSAGEIVEEVVDEKETRKRYVPYKIELKDTANVNVEKEKEAISMVMDKYNNLARNSKIFEIINNELVAGNKQIILTGAPGTGKTQGVKDYAKRENSDCKMVQFHPSYDYSDFVEGIRPVNVGEGAETKMIYVKLDGQFKKFCRKTVEENIEKFINDNSDVVKNVFKKDSKEVTKAEVVDKWYDLLNPSGEDQTDDEDQTDAFLDKMEEAFNPQVFFIIDEVNRADIAKVFGELMYGLEYRGVENRFDTQYQNLKTYDVDRGEYMTDDVFEKGFFVPKNVIIIGTMNDIDRSVESFDLAMRRRFQWPKVTANDMLSYVLNCILLEKGADSGAIDNLVTNIKAMNNIISKKEFLSEDYHIGPGYFKMLEVNGKKEINQKSLENIFDKKIDPLLREYVRGRRSMSSEEVNEFINNCRNALTKSSKEADNAISAGNAASGN